MVDAVRKSGVIGALNFHNRYYPIPYRMRRMALDGELGEIYHIQGGYLQDWLQYKTDFSWKLLSDQCGKTRATADLGSHWIDLAEYVTGQKVTEVFRGIQNRLSAAHADDGAGSERCGHGYGGFLLRPAPVRRRGCRHRHVFRSILRQEESDRAAGGRHQAVAGMG